MRWRLFRPNNDGYLVALLVPIRVSGPLVVFSTYLSMSLVYLFRKRCSDRERLGRAEKRGEGRMVRFARYASYGFEMEI